MDYDQVDWVGIADIWMREAGGLWEYVAVYVDDVEFLLRDPKMFVKTLEDKFKYKLTGTNNINFHLRCDLFRDNDGHYA